MTSKATISENQSSLFARLASQAHSTQFLLLAASLSFGACKDPKAAGPNTPSIAVGKDGFTLRETFSGSLEAWAPAEGSWQVRSAGGERVLAQTATNRTFPVTLWKSRRASDVDVTVRFKPISGEIDASGGIVFRAQDGANYYVVRANSLEDNFRLYTVIDGDRSKIAGAHIEEPELGEWHTLRVVAVDDHIQAYLDDRLLLDHRDKTFSEGWVGLWTKADAVTEFDDVEVRGVASGASPSASGDPAENGDPAETPSGATSERDVRTFEEQEEGKLSNPWSAPSGDWRVETVEDAPSGTRVVVQRASNRSPVFNVALLDSSHADVDVSVRLRARQGRIDQGGGIVWRAKDAHNYYIARYNPLEDNYRVYTVKNGRRRQIDSANVRTDHEAWHTLRVTMAGDHIECFLDGEKHLDVRDDTFTDAGMIGLWTKADAQTEFDDLEVRKTGAASGPPLDAEAIGSTVGTAANTKEDGVVRVTWSRTEVPVSVDGMRFAPAAGLTSWAGFSGTDGGAMLMGDTVVFQDEVSPAMDAAFANGLEITALHNHFFFDEPKVYFMHIGGHGDPNALARGVKAVWDAIREVRRQRPEPASTFAGDAPSPGGTMDADAIGRILGVEPSVKDGVVKASVGRKAVMHGTRFAGSMGLTTWVAFTGSNERAAIDGDFAMVGSEVQPVLRALRRAGIHVVALHNHMVGETPAYFFTHFWAKGPAAELARGFRAALDAQREAGGE